MLSGLSTYVLAGVTLIFLYAAFKVYTLMWSTPRNFMKHFTDQGIKSHPFKFLVGEILTIRDAAENYRLVKLCLENTEKLGYVHVMCTGFIPQLCMNDPELLKDVFGKKANCYHKATDEQKIIVRPLLGNGLLLSEDSYWQKQRKLVSPAFHFHNLNEMVPMMVKAAESMAQRWSDKMDATIGDGKGKDGASVEVDISPEMTRLTLDTVATAAFGSAFDEDAEAAKTFTESQQAVLEAMQERTLNLTGFLPIVRDLPLKSLKTIQNGCDTIRTMVHNIVQDRKDGKTHAVGGRTDLLDMLLNARLDSGEPMSQHAVEEESMTFITAGAETTSNLITWMLYRMTTEEGLWERCAAESQRVLKGEKPTPEALKELKLLEAVAYESLRLHAPAPMLPKVAIKDHVLGSGAKAIRIAKGQTLQINAHVVHRHPLYWDEPEVFRPERFLAPKDGEKRKKQHPYAFIGFSAGPRKCIGKNFAMLEIKVIVSTILQRFKFQVVKGQRIVPHPITRLPAFGILMNVTRAKQEALDEAAREHEASASEAQVLKPVGMI